MKHDSITKTLFVAIVLCVVCSVLVSVSAVKLKPLQVENKKLDIKKNLLLASGLIDNGDVSKEIINEKFKVIETVLVDLKTGERVEGIDPETFDMRKAAKQKGQNYIIPKEKNIAGILRRSKLAKVYLVREEGVISRIVLPVNGKGLWSTLYGFLVLRRDLQTIEGLGFYEHGETPGLGGEIDNPSWKKLWVGKKAFKEGSFVPVIKVVKGLGKGDHEVDGLSGATLTANGVSGLVRYWLGEDGFGPTLENFKIKGEL